MIWRYLISTPFSVNPGGTTNLCQNIIQEIQKSGINLVPLDFTNLEIDFKILLVFSFSFHNPDSLEMYKKRGIKIILWPIFDRTKPIWSFKMQSLLEKTPIRTLFWIRKRILKSADLILTGCESETNDLIECFQIDKNKIKTVKLAIAPVFFKPEIQKISPNLFFDKYGFTDFVIYSAAEINHRKNQILLLKAVQNTNVKVVLTGCDQVLVSEFQNLINQNPNILCLGKLPFEELISAYQNAKISISLSSSETAGLALLESAFFGCQLLVSPIPAFKEYLSEIAVFLDDLKPQTIKTKIEELIKKPRNLEQKSYQKNYIIQNYSFQNYIKQAFDLISKVNQ